MNWLKWAILITVTYAIMTELFMWQTSESEWGVMQSNIQVKQVGHYDNR